MCIRDRYVSRYTDPGMQVAATPTYPVSAEALNLMDSNPNIVDEAKQAIASRYNRNLRENYINGQINSVDGDERKSNLESSVEQHITQQKELRQQYLQSLEDAAAAADAAATSTTTNTTTVSYTHLDVYKRQDEYGHSFERELAYMLVHGFYHLMGYDHIKEDDKKVMREKEEKVLKDLNINRE